MSKLALIAATLATTLTALIGVRTLAQPSVLPTEARAETFEVKYNGSTLKITGGDQGGEDVSVDYDTVTSIAWVRVGTNFRFLDLEFNPSTGPFSSLSVSDSEISVLDTNQNQSGSPIEYKYTITYEDLATNQIKVYDPKVINKSSGGPN